MSGCSKGECSSCDTKSSCGIDKIRPSDQSRIKKIIGIVSGKGGVGKSLLTSMLAVGMTREGYRCGILDGDITGPSIPKAFGIRQKASGDGQLIFPAKTQTGIQVISTNMILEDEGMPVVWRGPVIAGVVKQFYQEVLWEDVDFLFVDMPPGTGDVPLTIFQSLPVDGIVIMTSPQELVSMIVEKAVNMAKMMKVPILGLVENMSYFLCPDNGQKYYIFGEGKTKEAADKHGLELLGQIPIQPEIASAIDAGLAETLVVPALDRTIQKLKDLASL